MRRVIAMTCLFLSGAAGLIYEVAWIRQASLIFGSTSLALSTVLAVFFGGLALGSEFFGRLSLGTDRPLSWFVGLELGVAATALSSLALFPLAESLYGSVYRALPETAASHAVLRVALVAAVLLVPTFLMGGTLPLFCRQFVTDRSRIAGSVGFLYGLNTAGAVAGCLAAGFWLIPLVGVRASVAVAAALNLVAAAFVGRLGLQADAPPDAGDFSARTSLVRRRVVGALFFVLGFVALGQEVLWARYLGLVVRNTVHTYTLTLGIVLVGIVLGSWIASRFLDRVRDLARLFGALQMSLAILLLTLMLLPPHSWRALGNELWVYVVLMLGPAALSGAAFPLAVRLVVHDAQASALGVGRMSALNTAGGIAGSMLVGFVVLPAAGLQVSAVINSGLGFAAGAVAWLFLRRERPSLSNFATVAALLAVWSALPKVLDTRIPQDFLAPPESLVDSREGRQSNLAVVRREGDLHLEIDRWWQGQARKNHQILAAHLPMLLHPDPQRVLVVGVGAGQTPGRFCLYDDVEQLDCVDIEPAVFDLIRELFPSGWLDDSRVRLLATDGRSYVAHTEERYDVISLELGQVFRPGVSSFYSVDFYRRVRDRLEPEGIVSQFVPLTLLAPQQLRSIVRSFLAVFPESSLWYNTAELILLGGHGSHLDGQRLRERLALDSVREDLQFSHWGGVRYNLNRPQNLLACYLMGAGGLNDLSEGAMVYRDDRPVLEYAASGVDANGLHEIPVMALLARHLDPLPPSLQLEASADSLAIVRNRNLVDLEASAWVRRALSLRDEADYEGVKTALLKALRANPENVLAHRLMGDVLVLRRQFDEASEHYERAIALHPTDSISLRGLAFVAHMTGQLSEARQGYQAALQHDPEDAEAHNNLGTVLGQLGDLAGARRHFEQAVRLRPGYGDALKNLDHVRQATTDPR